MKKPLLSSTVFILALVAAWKFSSANYHEQISLSSSSPVRINECEISESNNIRNSTAIKATVEKELQEQVTQTAVCKKWTEGNQALYIALYLFKYDDDRQTAAIALFQNANTVNEKPDWIFADKEGFVTLESGLYTINNSGKEEFLAIADLNQDSRPEIIFATVTDRNAALYGFQMDFNRKKLNPLIHKQKIEGTEMVDNFTIISMQQRPVAHIKRDGVASSVFTKDATLTAEKDQWIKTEL